VISAARKRSAVFWHSDANEAISESLVMLRARLCGGAGRNPKRSPAAKHKARERSTYDKVPVLVVRGTPAEMGEQFGVSR